MSAGHGSPARVSVPETTAWQVVEGRVVILELDDEHYYRLDEVGSRMWEVLCESGDLGAARKQLEAEFDVDPETLHRDLEAFVARLADAGLVTIEGASS